LKKPIEIVRLDPPGNAVDSIQPSALAKGQIWKAGENYVLIGDAGKRLIEYKMAKKLKQRGLKVHLASVETVRAFLSSNRAELMVTS
jgi:hypothetical protein